MQGRAEYSRRHPKRETGEILAALGLLDELVELPIGGEDK